MLSLLIFGFLGFGAGATTVPQEAVGHDLEIGGSIRTFSGLIEGHAAPLAPQVSEYLGIPYAKPPIGELRFAIPQPYRNSQIVNGTAFGFSCPVASTYSALLHPTPEMGLNFTTAGYKILDDIAQINDRFSEDCLTLNIWTKPQTGEKKKAVMLWIPGGGYIAGAANAPAYNGAHIADREDVVVVSINYRLNILGFPGAPEISNLGLLDQRLAIEWVRDNIAGFGGDPSRITIFGESAGGGSVDLYSYAWTEDPIVAGFIAQSGTTQVIPPVNASTASGFWYNVTSQVGCGDASSNTSVVLACMRKTDVTAIMDAISQIPNIKPIIDEKIVFSDYPQRALAGNFTKRPMLIGHTDNEAGMADIVARMKGITTPTTALDAFNLEVFFCPAAVRANVSVYNNVPIWRYRYFGDFPNMEISSTIETGAYHGSEVNILFDTTYEGEDIPASTPEEVSFVKYMRGAWAAFAKDPKHGLDAYNWPQFDPTKKSLVRLAYNNQMGPNAEYPIVYDAACSSTFQAMTDES